MRSLYESILSKTNVGVVVLDIDQINTISTTILNSFFNMELMYHDAKEITGETPSTHTQAFAIILCNNPITRSDWNELLSAKDRKVNDIIDGILKRIFKKYLKYQKTWHFYFVHQSPLPKGYFYVGILDMAFKSYNILSFNPKEATKN